MSRIEQGDRGGNSAIDAQSNYLNIGAVVVDIAQQVTLMQRPNVVHCLDIPNAVLLLLLRLVDLSQILDLEQSVHVELEAVDNGRVEVSGEVAVVGRTGEHLAKELGLELGSIYEGMIEQILATGAACLIEQQDAVSHGLVRSDAAELWTLAVN